MSTNINGLRNLVARAWPHRRQYANHNTRIVAAMEQYQNGERDIGDMLALLAHHAPEDEGIFIRKF